ncbi:hypothetical protein SNEBB_002483 [Seison nebaliae]|nr:hypothetical protein SNEBB_002483 [Seison nebaliae]
MVASSPFIRRDDWDDDELETYPFYNNLYPHPQRIMRKRGYHSCVNRCTKFGGNYINCAIQCGLQLSEVAWNEIVDGVYLANILEMTDSRSLRRKHIGGIISICEDFMLGFVKLQCLRLSMKHLVIYESDTSFNSLYPYFDETYEFIESVRKKHQGVIIHCFAGLSRSATIITAYLIRKYNYSFERAMNLMNSKKTLRHNASFLKDLKKYAYLQNFEDDIARKIYEEFS